MGLGGEVEAIVVLVHLRTWDSGILRTTIDHGEGRERKKTGALLSFSDRHVHFEARAVVCHGEGYGRAFRRRQGRIYGPIDWAIRVVDVLGGTDKKTFCLNCTGSAEFIKLYGELHGK